MGAGGIEWNETQKRLVWNNVGVVYAAIALPTDALVLDIGGGSDPHPAANVILDKFIDDNSHRPGHFGMERSWEFVTKAPDGTETSERRVIPIVCADALHIPFPDKSFDFIITKDVLEHIDDVRGAMAEISRVGKAGFIDSPRLASEYLFPLGTDIHKWVFENTEQGTIRARSVANFHSPFGNTMHEIFSTNKEIQRAWSVSRHYFHLCAFWKDSIDCEIGEAIA